MTATAHDVIARHMANRIIHEDPKGQAENIATEALVALDAAGYEVVHLPEVESLRREIEQLESGLAEAQYRWELATDAALGMRAQIGAVRELHHKDSYGDCAECPGAYDFGPNQEWPCPTIQALDGEATDA